MWAKQKQSGFTIVELLIVIVVIGILAAITIVAYNGIQTKAKTAALQTDLENTAKTLEQYKLTNTPGVEQYPSAGNIQTALKLGTDTTFTPASGYIVNNAISPAAYCLTLGSNSLANTPFSVSSTSSVPTAGSCVTNAIPNPGFEVNMDNWSPSNCNSPTRDTAVKNSGSYSFKCSVAGDNIVTFYAGPSNPVTVGDTYTVSAYLRSTRARTAEIYISMLNSSSAEVARVNSNYTTLSANTWVRGSASGVVPAGTVAMRIQINYRDTLMPEQVWVDDVMYTAGAKLYSYGDGNSSSWWWTGAANNSSSVGPAV